MNEQNQLIYEFGPFSLDVGKRQLVRAGEPVKLYPKEFDTLLALVERSGQVVDKEELLSTVWPDATVEEGNLTTHVSRLRKVLGGGGSQREYIVTLPGRGYQFVAEVKRLPAEPVGRSVAERMTSSVEGDAVASSARPRPRASRSRLLMVGLGLMLLAAGIAVGVVSSRRLWQSSQPSFHQLTFRRGTIWSARFTPDAQTVVYGAAWDGRPIQLFSTRPESPESRSLGLHDADVLSISRSGEMAIALDRSVLRVWESSGTLARLPLAGGGPREVLENVKDADWSPDGTSLAIVRRVSGRDRLEFPIGKVLYEAQGFIICPRISRKGDTVAFLERRSGNESVGIVNLAGQKKTLASEQNGETGLAWWPSDKELFFTVAKGGSTAIYAVTPSGKQRLVTQAAGEWALHDVSPDGRTLLTQNHKQGRILGVPPGESLERDLSWLDRSVAVDLSVDGSTLLLSEVGAAGGETKAAYIRKTDGSPAVKLGDGDAEALSPDGKWVIVNQGSAPERLVLLPTGVGQPRPVKNGTIIDYYRVKWLPDGRHIVFGALEAGQNIRPYIQDIDGGDPQPTTLKGGLAGAVFLPDGKSYVARGAGRRYHVFDIEGRDARPVPGVVETDYVIQVSADGRSLFVLHGEAAFGHIDMVDLMTGSRKLWKEIIIPDPAGVTHLGPEFPAVLVTPDGRSYFYNYLRVLSDLYVVDGLK